VLNLWTLLVGPLAGPECRRALGRGWVILVRSLAGVAVFLVTALAFWSWWINNQFSPDYQPYWELRLGLTFIAGALLTIALVLGPALIAGSLAGEKERGAMALLLTTRMTSREIVAGRLAGKLSQLAMVVGAGVPALVFTAALAGVGPATILVFLILPAAVGFGGGGLAALASVLSRRGRDALLTVYLVDLFLMLTPLSSILGLPPAAFDWVSALNPFVGLDALVEYGDPSTALTSAGMWVVLGAVGMALASWRLRPSCLASSDGARALKARRGRGFVPPMDEKRPMVWKELFVEKVATLGRFGSWMGFLIVAALVAVSVGMTVVIDVDIFIRHDNEWADWARSIYGELAGSTGGLLACLIQWAIGLRAAVSISSERERGTWDSLLLSPLEAREIVRGKVYGSLYALRWLIAAAFLWWALAAGCGAIEIRTAVTWALSVLFVGAFLAAVGVRTSLASPTATRAMSVTIGIWLGAYAAVTVGAALILLTGLLAWLAGTMALAQAGVIAMPRGAPPLPGYVAWPLAMNALYFLMTSLIVADTALRFDRIAGRMTQGGVSVIFDELLYGRPEEPVLIDGTEDLEVTPVGDGWDGSKAKPLDETIAQSA
jgi:ABC-type transport system involved in multi-copper enzyme maturation permease subunit